MMDWNVDEIYDTLVSVAGEGGRMIRCANPSALDNTSKKNTADIVTETDQAIERMVSSRLMAKYPTFAFIGEESWKPDLRLTDAPTFIVDPIDGTSNFVHSFPSVCISLAFVVKKQPTIGVVFNPFTDELYSAIRGRGAFVQRPSGPKQRLPLKANPDPLFGLKRACIGIEWGSDREGVNFDLNLKVFIKLASSIARGGRMVNSLRCTGSAALAICAVAAGQQDMFWECGCWAWDVAAAWCILTEAGGIMVDGHPDNWSPAIDGRRYLAVRAAPSGQGDIIEEFWDVIGDGRSTYSNEK